jgi:hypothetical protein
MSKKLEKDFEDFNKQIEKLAEDELENVKAKVDAVKAEAEKIGESAERSVGAGKEKD